MDLKDILGEIMANASGQSLEEHIEKQAFRNSLRPISEKVIGLPPEDWPNLAFNWDLSSQGRKYSFDGPGFLPSEKDIPAAYRQWEQDLHQYEIGWVSVNELDEKLCSFNHRKEPWVKGSSESRLADVIAHLSEGHSISPVVIQPASDNKVLFTGGNHRYTAAKFSGEQRIPVYYLPEHRGQLGAMVEIENVSS